DSVTTDDFGGGYLVGEHLLRSGRTRLGFVAEGRSLPHSVQSRWNGLHEAMDNRGAPAGGRRLFTDWPDEAALVRWIEDERIDAVLCGNDRVALGVLNALSGCGIAVPERVAVVGYDDILMSEFAHPPLTTVRQEFRAVGQSAGRLLVQRMRKFCGPPRHV